MSQNTGSAPSRDTTSAVAMYVNGVVITASPGPIFFANKGIKSASVPEEQEKQYSILL